MKDLYRNERGRKAIERWCTDQLDAWPVPHRRGLISANDATTHLVTAGTGPRTAVFVPGTNFCAASCLPLATALAARCRVVLADLPGQPGLSSGRRIPAPQRHSWYGRWLAEVLDQVTGSPVVLVGHSLGAAIALATASPLVSRQVLLSPGGLIRARITPGIAAASASWLLRRRPVDSARLLTTMLAPGDLPRPELVEWMTLIARHARSSLDPAPAVVADRAVERVVAVGDHDRYFPSGPLAAAARRTLGLPLSVLPSAGHLITEGRPDRLADLIAT
ncbi:Pimeloyl-ACP methyl ester carboxylesterase [Saccharopolyspora kobensis]|uniref:Pimeloyl-ACP methyl ester carboxylesterase n=1 Tax=Saccharopolyspora kobensis TaxID=146035 RepID=A0A1H6BK42_9PSEU|nr:alpha/beta hydrolase [Saccharopolyspora kobensis]SEG61043.1 Pimeloyl-ACP methyl ester carboxylesterase [Saccharopolyspora kobensis]SFE87588.1 Pimeloyl-ACP methyl ester carboxylesterase [Saccharopolyspora kobensis]